MSIIKNSFFKDTQLYGFFIALTFLTTTLYAYQVPPTLDEYAHLEPILINHSKDAEYRFVLPEVQSVLIENSNLIRSLQEIEIANDFLPYIEDYERLKGSPIDQNIRIFFYDGSKLSIDHEYRLTERFCFYFFGFIFINNRLWSNYFVNITHETFSILDQVIEERRQNPSSIEDDILLERLSQVIPNEHLQPYLSFDTEARNRVKRLTIGIEEQKEASLSDEERYARDYFLRQLTLFHELGHCDLKREHEETATSIMDERVITEIQKEIISEYPQIDLNSLLNNSLTTELFTQRNTIFEQPGVFDSWLARLGLGPASEKNRTKAVRNIQRSIEIIEDLIMTTDLYD